MQMRWVSKGVHLLIKFLVLTGAVLSVLPLVFLISGAFMGESELEHRFRNIALHFRFSD